MYVIELGGKQQRSKNCQVQTRWNFLAQPSGEHRHAAVDLSCKVKEKKVFTWIAKTFSLSYIQLAFMVQIVTDWKINF